MGGQCGESRRHSERVLILKMVLDNGLLNVVWSSLGLSVSSGTSSPG